MVVKRGLPDDQIRRILMDLLCYKGFILPYDNGQVGTVWLYNNNRMYMIGHNNRFFYPNTREMSRYLTQCVFCNPAMMG